MPSAMTLTLLEAGEKVVNPPLVATEQVVRSDVAIFAGGITWIDAEHDDRLGPAGGAPCGCLRARLLQHPFAPHAIHPFKGQVRWMPNQLKGCQALTKAPYREKATWLNRSTLMP